jgi:hypothetical protein
MGKTTTVLVVPPKLASWRARKPLQWRAAPVFIPSNPCTIKGSSSCVEAALRHERVVPPDATVPVSKRLRVIA